MSGFEIAGVVLGAFPILLTALEHYREVARTAGLWYNIRQEHQKCKNEVNAQRVAFIGNLKRLLLPLDIDDTSISHLLAAPGGNGWKDAGIARQLQHHLLDSYEVFMETIESMRDAAEKLKKEMAADKHRLQQSIQQAKSPKLALRLKEAFNKPAATREFHLYRLQFSLGESVRKELFDEMQRYNDRLRTLLETSDAVSQAERTRGAAKLNLIRAAVSGFWQQADQLYKVLSKAWNCGCWRQHYAHLLLQNRVSAEGNFHFMFWSNSHHLPAGSNSWLCRPARVEVRNEPEAGLPIRSPPEPTTASLPQHRTATPLRPSIASSKTSQTKTSRKSDSGAPTITITHVQAGLGARTNTSTCSLREEISQISSLCASFRQDPPQATCHGYLQAHDKRFYIYRADTAGLAPSNPSTTITLERILHGNNNNHPVLTRRQRYALAVTLASSFLQLAGTPWIKPRWAKSDVVFFRDPHDPAALLLERPFVCSDFQDPLGVVGEPQPAEATPPPRSAKQVQEDTISGLESLGIVLLELCFGRPIELHPFCKYVVGAQPGTSSSSESELGVASPSASAGARFLAALEWLRDVTEEAGMDYAEAVAWCLVGGRMTAASGEGWRGVMLERVVRSLEACCGYLGPAPGAQIVC